MKARLLLPVLLALFVSACTVPAASRPAEAEIPATQTLSTPASTRPAVQGEPSLPTGNLPEMATYTDDLAGFSLDYPAGWFIEDSVLVHAQESSNYSISISSWDVLNPPPPSERQTNGLPNGGAKFDVTVIKDPMTLQAAVDQVRQTNTPIFDQKDVTLANGVPGILLDIEGFAGPARMLISILNGNVIYVTGYGNLEYFEPVALSLRAH